MEVALFLHPFIVVLFLVRGTSKKIARTATTLGPGPTPPPLASAAAAALVPAAEKCRILTGAYQSFVMF